MAYNYNILLGHITKASGFEGAVSVKLERSFIGNIPHLESVFLEIEGRRVPFFVHESDYRGNDILKIRFTGYYSSDKVSEFRGCKVFLTTAGEAAGQQENIQELTGYEVLSEDNAHIGHVKEVIQNPEQWLLNITSPQKKEILIPFHEDLIVLIDGSKKTVVLKIPEGLTEIN